MVEHDVIASDGRTLKVLEDGDSSGRPVLMHNGTPNSRLMFAPDVELATRQGIRLISYDRPGYGGSTHQPNRTVADCAQDVRAIAAALGIDRIAVWGISGGGPHALACAALLPDLVPAVASLASLAPWGAAGLDYFAGMGELNVEDIQLTIDDPSAGRAKCEQDRLETLALTAEDLMGFLQTLLSPPDAAVLTGELGGYLVAAGRSGLAPGSDGWWADNLAFVSPWGFALDAIRTPVLLRHGREDHFVPFGHGEWLADHIPGVEAVLTDDDGHLTLTANHLAATHEWLLNHL